MFEFSAPAMPVARENRQARILDKFEMPRRGSDKVYTYVSTFKEGSPFFSKHIGGVSFSRYTLPPEWSYRDNADKTYFPRKATVALTEKQAEAIIERSKLIHTKTPRIEDKDGNVTQSMRCTMYDHIVLEKAEEYAQKQFKMPKPVVPMLENDEDAGVSVDGIKDELVKQQKGNGNKRGPK